VYELDPLLEVNDAIVSPVTSFAKDTNEQTEGPKLEPSKPKEAYLAFAQRKSDLITSDYLHPFVHRVFGTPFVLRVYDLENCTGRQVYDAVARRLRTVVARPFHRFLSSNKKPTTDSTDVKGPTSQAFQDVNTSAYRTLTDMEEVSAGPVPRYGFRLRLTTRDGRRCLSCPWYEACIGCLVPDDDKPTVLMDSDSAVVDWHFAVDLATNGFGLHSNDPLRSNATVPIEEHSSCGTGLNKNSILKQPGAVTLEECLDAFAKEEKIPEAYCSRCKEFRVQTKRMSLWRLPPIMIIHLKRFQFTQHMRRKLRDLVVFPIEGLDLSRIMAPTAGSAQTASNNSPEEIKDSGRSEMLYDLYGVVHHQGALSGGHYVASLKSEVDGQFRMFNDAYIYDIHARDIVDASAYILFYIRRDVAKAKLSDFWNVREEGANSVSEEEMNQLLKGRSDRCVIS
jgi:Ubiquitin carboxyl-terminal hydrolase